MIDRIIGCSDEGDCHVLSVLVLGMKFADASLLMTNEEELVWPVSADYLQGEKGWKRLHEDQICRLKVRRMKASCFERPEERLWCLSEVMDPDADCPELEALLDKLNTPLVIWDDKLGELTLERDAITFETVVSWLGEMLQVSLGFDDETESTCSQAAAAAKKMLEDCERWDDELRSFAMEARPDDALAKKRAAWVPLMTLSNLVQGWRKLRCLLQRPGLPWPLRDGVGNGHGRACRRGVCGVTAHAGRRLHERPSTNGQR